MKPYIVSKRKNSNIESNVDFAVLNENLLISLSLIDEPSNVKNIISDIVSNKDNVVLNNREDYRLHKVIRGRNYLGENTVYNYKLSKHDEEVIHGMVVNSKLDNYSFDWDREGKIESLSKFLRNRYYLPVTNDIVNKVYNLVKDEMNEDELIKECEVYTSRKDMEDFKVYYISDNSVNVFKTYLKKIELNNASEDDFNWEKINDITDYLIEFSNPIKNKIQDKINILYDENEISEEIYSKRVPYDGQLPVIQGGLNVLKRKENRFLYIAGEPGTGKTTMGIKTNHVYHIEKNKMNYCTLIVAPTITLTQWKEEIYETIGNDVDVIIVKNTNEFIRFYNRTKMKVNKPTYILVGKETFKLSYKTKHGINTTNNLSLAKDGIDNTENITKLCTCPSCGLPLKNPLRKGNVYLTEDEFKTPKKSNYKCSECGTVLWQAEYIKNRKTSVVDFIKRKNIKIDSTILDEAHESNNFGTVIGNATRVLLQRSKKSILLSGTVSNGYASSIYNILFALIPNTLKRDNVFDLDKFVEQYGTLKAVTKNKNNDYNIMNKNKVSANSYQEIEGVNPLVFARYFANSFIFVNLNDIKNDIPSLNEHYINVKQADVIKENEQKLREDIKKVSPYSASFYNESVIKHYANKPFNWSEIPFNYYENDVQKQEVVNPVNTNLEQVLLPKEKELIKICKEKASLREKVWVYNDFITNGKYTNGQTLEDRLKEVLEQAGLKVYVLKSTVKTIDRKKTIEKFKDEYDVFISNAQLVGTGVNMQWCSNYVFYSPTYHVNTVRQASRRGLRANSTKESNIYHLYYDSGVEKEIMQRFKLKLAESESVQAKFVHLEGVERTASSLGAKIEKELTV